MITANYEEEITKWVRRHRFASIQEVLAAPVEITADVLQPYDYELTRYGAAMYCTRVVRQGRHCCFGRKDHFALTQEVIDYVEIRGNALRTWADIYRMLDELTRVYEPEGWRGIV